MKFLNVSLLGSSPLTRGKRRARRQSARLSGLIPAHAGKTFLMLARLHHQGAHPRSRGENISEHANSDPAHGSSPLTRGKQDGPNYIAGRLRLIPAHAGKTATFPLTPSWPRAHPRSRGENRRRSRSGPARRGSSPLTRGKLRRRPRSAVHAWLIPAHAGKTRGRCAQLRL